MENSLMNGNKPVSNWDKPGGKLGMVVAGVVGAVVLWKVLPFLLAITWGLVELAIAASILTLIIFLFTDKKVRMLVSTGYFMIMKAITGAFVEINPIAIVERRILEMKKKINEISEKMGILNGFNKKTHDTLVIKQNQFETEILRIKEYKERGLEPEAQMSNNQAIRLDAQVKNLKQRLADGKKTYDILSQLERMAKLSVQDTENDVDIQKENYESAKQQYKVFKSVMSVMNGDPDEMAMFNMAMDKMTVEINDKLGEMDHVLNQTGGLLVQFSIDNGVADRKANELLDRYDKFGINGMFDTFIPKSIEDNSVNYVKNISIIDPVSESNKTEKKTNTYF